MVSSCGCDKKAEPIKMRAFFLSIDKAGTVGCGYENTDMYLKGDASAGKLDVEIISTSPTFPDLKFSYKGTKIIKGKGEQIEETIVASYVTESGDGSRTAGTFNLVSRTDDEIAPGATIFTGHWAGNAIRPEGNPMVMCPYVLVPRDALDGENCGKDVTQMAAGLRKYFADSADNPTRIEDCYRQFADEGKFSPTVFE